MPDHRHGVVAPVAQDLDDVSALPDGDHCRVRPEPRWVYPDHDGRRVVLVWLPLHGLVGQVRRYELVVACAWKLTVHLNVRLCRVGPVLSDDLLVGLPVGALYCAGVHHLGFPEVPLGVEGLVKVASVAPGVTEREPEPVRCVLSKKTCRHRPDTVRNTTGLVEDDAHPVEVVYASECVRVLLGPQPTLDRPVARAFLQVALD